MFKITHTFICKECGKEFENSFASDIIQNPIATLPFGWSQLQDGYVCDNHIITITNKEEIVE